MHPKNHEEKSMPLTTLEPTAALVVIDLQKGSWHSTWRTRSATS